MNNRSQTKIRKIKESNIIAEQRYLREIKKSNYGKINEGIGDLPKVIIDCLNKHIGLEKVEEKIPKCKTCIKIATDALTGKMPTATDASTCITELNNPENVQVAFDVATCVTQGALGGMTDIFTGKLPGF